MSQEMVLELLASAGQDISYHVDGDGDIIAIVQDFEGFDDDWSEVFSDYDEDLIDSIEEQLEESCLSREGDFYYCYHFDGFSVVWGYASYDI